MQVKLNTNHRYNQNFGIGQITPKAEAYIKRGIKTEVAEMRINQEISKLLPAGANITDFTIDCDNGKLIALISSQKGGYKKTITESIFSRIFRSRLSFVKDVAKETRRISNEYLEDIGF